MSHHFAFVDPSGTVVYPKGTKRHMFSRCMDWTLQGIPHGLVAETERSSEADKRMWHDWVEANRVNKLVYIGPWGTLGIMGCLSWFFMFGVGAVGQPHVITKSMMMRRIGDIKHIVPLTFLAYIASALLWLGIGLAMRALVVSGAHPALLTPDAAAPQFLQNYTHPLLAGVVFAGLLAAIMSTADGFLNIGKDLWRHRIPPPSTASPSASSGSA